MGTTKLAGEGNKEVVDRAKTWYDKVFLQRVNLWKINETVRRYMLSPELGKMLCELTGVDGLRVWHDQTLQKQPWANPTSWHVDVPNWSFYSHQSISIWIALDDATIQNGCLYYLPGTHKRTRFERSSIGSNMDGLFESYPEFSEIEAVAGEMAAGRRQFPQRPARSRCRAEHDPALATGDDLRLHARQLHV